jgi:hypothetical protein
MDYLGLVGLFILCDVSAGGSWDKAIPGKTIADAHAEKGFSRSLRSGMTGSNPSFTCGQL